MILCSLKKLELLEDVAMWDKEIVSYLEVAEKGKKFRDLILQKSQDALEVLEKLPIQSRKGRDAV